MEAYPLLLLLLTLLDAFVVDWHGNLTLNIDYAFRLVSFSSPQISPYNTLYLTSLNLSSSDALYGSIYTEISPSNTPPSAYLASFRSASSWTDGESPISGNVAHASGYVAMTYLVLEEVNNTGFVFQTFNLSALTWNLSQVSSKDGLNFAIFSSSQSGGFSVKLLSVVSEVVGILTTGVILTPQSIEMSLEIYGFPYINETNSVRLSMALVTSTANASTNATVWVNSERERYVYGRDETAVYYDLAFKALCDDVMRTVEIRTLEKSVTALENNYLQAQVGSMINATSHVLLKQIIFPAGVMNITYDPTIGSGPGPSEATVESNVTISSAFTSMLTVIALLAVFVLAAGVAYYIRHRKLMARGVEMKKKTYSPLET